MIPDYLKQVKINVKNHEQSVAVQQALFKLGCKWLSGDKVIQCNHVPWLFVSDSGEITFTTDYLWGKNNSKYDDITDQISFIGDEAVFEFDKEETSKDIDSTSKFTSELPATNLVPNTVDVSTDLDKQIQSLAQQMREKANEALRKAGYIKK